MTHSPRPKHAAPGTPLEHEPVVAAAEARLEYGRRKFSSYSEDELLMLDLVNAVRGLADRLEEVAAEETAEYILANGPTRGQLERLLYATERRLPTSITPATQRRIKTQADEAISAEAGHWHRDQESLWDYLDRREREQESEKRTRLKTVTGTNTVPTERRDITFPPDAKLIVTTGHLPTKERGLWRRVRRTDQQ